MSLPEKPLHEEIHYPKSRQAVYHFQKKWYGPRKLCLRISWNMCTHVLQCLNIHAQSKRSIKAFFFLFYREWKAVVSRSPEKFPCLGQEDWNTIFVFYQLIRGFPSTIFFLLRNGWYSQFITIFSTELKKKKKKSILLAQLQIFLKKKSNTDEPFK